MEKVSIIDIQGEQWPIEDENARKKIAELETEIKKLKTIEKWDYTIPNYGGHITARRQGNVVNVIGENIGRINKIPKDVGDFNFAILPERFRPTENCFYMCKIDGSYRTQYGGVVFPNGKINFWTYVDVDYGNFSLSYIVD